MRSGSSCEPLWRLSVAVAQWSVSSSCLGPPPYITYPTLHKEPLLGKHPKASDSWLLFVMVKYAGQLSFGGFSFVPGSFRTRHTVRTMPTDRLKEPRNAARLGNFISICSQRLR